MCRKLPLVFAVLAQLVSSCNVTQSTSVTDLVPSRVIVNSLKCDIARYFAYERRPGVRAFIISGGPVIEATLTLNSVDEHVLGAGVDIDPSVLTLGSAQFGLSGSRRVKKSVTTLRTIKMQFTPQANDTSICDLAGNEKLRNGVGIYAWLSDLNTDLESIARGAPLVLFDKFSFSTEFGVTKTNSASGSVGFLFVPVKGSLDLTQTRSDVQKVEITLTTKKFNPSAGSSAGSAICNPEKETCPTKKPPQVTEEPKCNPLKETCPTDKDGSSATE